MTPSKTKQRSAEEALEALDTAVYDIADATARRNQAIVELIGTHGWAYRAVSAAAGFNSHQQVKNIYDRETGT